MNAISPADKAYQDFLEFEEIAVKWYMVDSGEATVKEYRRDRRKLLKLRNAYCKVATEQTNKKTKEKFEIDLALANNNEIRAIADRLHETLCTSRNHTEDCDYYYGSWEKSIRRSMLDWYAKAEKLIEKHDRRNLLVMIDTIERSNDFKKILKSLN